MSAVDGAVGPEHEAAAEEIIEAAADPSEIDAPFATREEWVAFMLQRPRLSSPSYIDEIVSQATSRGILSGVLGSIPPEQVSVQGPNYRESLFARGLNSRNRAVLELMGKEPWFHDPAVKIYAAEALTPFALAMRGRYARFLGSEYAPTAPARDALYPIEHQDLMGLTLLPEAFDCVIANDCFEHVPNVQACLAEICRVLRPGGVMLATFPFTFRQLGETKARLVEGGEIEYLTEPEYHSNPADLQGGSLVFHVPGWDILDDARRAGFTIAEMVLVSGLERGITGAEIAGVFVMRCRKAPAAAAIPEAAPGELGFED